MTNKRLPKAVFEVGATAIARMHISAGEPVASLAEAVWAEYASQCDDPTAVLDWISAANQCIAFIQ